MLSYAYVSIASECYASDYWEMSPSLPFPSTSIRFSSIAGVECYIVEIEGLSEFFSASMNFRSSSSEAYASPMLTASFVGHILGLLPLYFEILFVMVSK